MPEKRRGVAPETVGEDGAKIVISNLRPRRVSRRRRKPIVPNKDGVDRVTILSQSSGHLEVDCRFRYENQPPQDHVILRLSIPDRENIVKRILRERPNLRDASSDRAVKLWTRDFVRKKIRFHWQQRKASKKLYISEDEIGDIV